MSIDHEELRRRVSPYDCLIFDLDDTIYDQSDYDRLAFLDVARRLNMGFTETEAKMFAARLLAHKRAIGFGYGRLFDDALAWVARPALSVGDCIRLYRQHDARGLRPQASLANMICELRDGGRLVFVITNGQREVQMRKLRALGLLAHITGFYVADPVDVAPHLKPDPFYYWEVLRNFPHRAAVVIGDKLDVDGKFAEKCGIPFILFRYGETP